MKIRRVFGLIPVIVAAMQASSNAAVQSTLYVSPTGTGDYSQSSPGSLSGIQAKVRTLNGAMTGDIVVYLKGGVYTLTAPMNFGPSDGGSGTNIVAYRNAPGEKPIISGGRQVTGWTKGSGTIWSAAVTGVNRKIRNMFVNGIRANMAKGPTATASSAGGGCQFNSTAVGVYARPRLIELRSTTNGWSENTFCVLDIATVTGGLVFNMQQPYFSISQQQSAWMAPFGKGNQDFEFLNALEFLDTAGEFYYDGVNKLYYLPRAGEDLATADVQVALSEGLLNIAGTSTTNRVNGLQFWGLTFEYSDWLMRKAVSGTDTSYGCAYDQATAVEYASEINAGSCDLDHCHQSRYASLTTPLAAIGVESATNIDFEWNVIKHTGSLALCFKNDVSNSSVIGNLIYDVGGGGISVGHPQDVFIGDSSATYPQEYGPTREGTCKNVRVSNNCVHTVSVHFRGETGITSYCTEAIDISHNEVYDCPYTAVSVGWGWGHFPGSTVAKNNKINYNEVHDYMKVLNDGGGIYTLSQQPGSQMIENYLYNTNNGGCIYLDEGTAGYTVQHNVLILNSGSSFDLVTENEDGVNTITNNGTQDQSVKDSSGLQACYKSIVNEPIAPLPGDVTCAVTGISQPEVVLRAAVKPAVTKTLVFDLRGRLLSTTDHLSSALRGGARPMSAGILFVKKEFATGSGGRAVLAVVK